ncbi:MAG: calcium-binding protein [Pikeienuella sp.]
MPLITSPAIPNSVEPGPLPEIFPAYFDLPSTVATTGTRMDVLTAIVENDAGLAQNVTDEAILAGAEAANGINAIITEIVADLGLADDGLISEDDVRAINEAIRADDETLADFLDFHGFDTATGSVGYHQVQGDGGSIRLFGLNAVDTVGDQIFHIGFEIDEETGRFLNQNGNPNIQVSSMATALTYFLGDVSTTGTGLDAITDAAFTDSGLARRTSPADIIAGAQAADGLNHLILDAIDDLGLGDDGEISTDDVVAINGWIRDADAPERLETFVQLHGNDENGVETGYHLIQADGALGEFGGRNLFNNVADGLYHIGFEIDAETLRFENEDGDLNAAVGQVATWLTAFLYGATHVFGTDIADRMVGSEADETFSGLDGADAVFAGEGDDLLDGGAGADLLRGWLGDDEIRGGADDDRIFAGEGADIVTGGTGRDFMSLGDDDDVDIIVLAPGDTGATSETSDRATDFDADGEDLLDLTAFGTLAFVEDAAFTATGQVSIEGRTVVLNLEGDTEVDAAILLRGSGDLGVEDLLLA